MITQLVADILVAIELFAYGNWAFLAIVVVCVAIPFHWTPKAWAPRDSVALTIVVALSLAWVIGAAIVHGVPLPHYHDDFAYLLAADTFLHGHLAYPQHPLWPHFETMHVLQTPHYASKFPPAQSVALAAGIALFGIPLAGVWITVGLAAAAVWWALRVWTTAELALIGGIAVAIHRTTLIWGEVYHGGAIAAGAGAVMLAAAGRLIESPSRRHFAFLCAGAIVLAFSRPYEGLVYTIGIAVMLLVATRGRWLALARVSAAGIAVLIAGAALTGVYNHAVTGSAFVHPHALYDAQYLPVPNFIWESPKPFPHYASRDMEHLFRVDYFNFYNRGRTPAGMRAEAGKKLAVIGFGITGAPFSAFANAAWMVMFVPLIALVPLLREERKARWIAIVVAIFAFAPFSIIWWLQLHYLAPAMAAAAVLIMMMLARLAAMRRGALLAAAILALFTFSAIGSWIGFVRSPETGFEARRRQIARSILSGGGKQLVIVAPDVYNALFNDADIDHAPIVWARDLGAERDRALIAYFHDRRVWQLVNEHGTPVIRRYTAPR